MAQERGAGVRAGGLAGCMACGVVRGPGVVVYGRGMPVVSGCGGGEGGLGGVEGDGV